MHIHGAKACTGSVAPAILNFGSRWSCQHHAPADLLARRNICTHGIGCWMGPSAGLDVSEQRKPPLAAVRKRYIYIFFHFLAAKAYRISGSRLHSFLALLLVAGGFCPWEVFQNVLNRRPSGLKNRYGFFFYGMEKIFGTLRVNT